MKYPLLLIILLAFNINSCVSQPTSKRNFTDFVVSNSRIWALTSFGEIKVFDENGAEIGKQLPQNNGIFLLTKNTQQQIVVADSTGHIRVFNENTNNWTTTGTWSNTLYGIMFDSHNVAYQVTSKGIKAGKRYYTPDTAYSTNRQIRFTPGLIARPSAIYLDKSNNLWFGYAGGEWGGDIYIFDTQNKSFIKPNVKWVEPVQSIIEVENAIYISSGVQHFDTSGEILKFEKFNAETVFSSDSYKKDQNGKSLNMNGEYIGPATFNKFDGFIYFYSQHGFFKGNPKSDLSDIKNWQHVFSPTLHWKYGQNNAVGSAMNVLKIEFIETNKLLIATTNDGLILHDETNQVTLN